MEISTGCLQRKRMGVQWGFSTNWWWHLITGPGAISSESSPNVNDQSVSRERSLLLPLSLCVFSGHSWRQDILFNQPLVLPEIALTLLFDDTNSKCLWKAEFLLIILSNPRTLSEQLRFCLHIQQDAAKEAICPQINYCILHCFCGAKWMRHPWPQPCPFWNHLPIV